MSWKANLLDRLKLLGVVVVLFGVGVPLILWSRSDSDIAERARALASEMCRCRDLACAEAVGATWNQELAGKKVAARDDGLSSDWSKADSQRSHMDICHRYIAEGTRFTVERDRDGFIRYVRPDGQGNAVDLDLGAVLAP